MEHNSHFFLKILIHIFLKDLIYLREHEQRGGAEREGEADSSLSPVQDSLQDSILGPWNHDLSQRQTLNQLSHSGALCLPFFPSFPACVWAEFFHNFILSPLSPYQLYF